MITAGSVVGGIVKFIVTKVASRIGTLATDKRRKACRALTKLYYCVSALDECTQEVLHGFTGLRKEGAAFYLVNALVSRRREIELATEMFVNLGYELEAGLRIIDPALAHTCQLLYCGKFDFLYFMSTCVELDRAGGSLSVTLKAPTGAWDNVDMEHLYRDSEVALGKGDKFFWPESALDDYSAGFSDVIVEDDEVAARLHVMLARQKEALGQAREGLRTLLAEKFSVEEILFQADAHPYR